VVTAVVRLVDWLLPVATVLDSLRLPWNTPHRGSAPADVVAPSTGFRVMYSPSASRTNVRFII